MSGRGRAFQKRPTPTRTALSSLTSSQPGCVRAVDPVAIAVQAAATLAAFAADRVVIGAECAVDPVVTFVEDRAVIGVDSVVGRRVATIAASVDLQAEAIV